MASNTQVAGQGPEEIERALAALGEEGLSSEKLRAVEKKILGLTLGGAGGSGVFIAEGTLQGFPAYFRFRRGTAKLKVGADPMARPLYEAKIEYSPQDPTNLNFEEFEELMVQLVSKLARAPFPYQFAGKKVRLQRNKGKVKVVASEEEEVFQAWGHSPEEAYRKIADPSEELVPVGLSIALQEEVFRLQAVSPEPLNSDDREFPKEDPFLLGRRELSDG